MEDHKNECEQVVKALECCRLNEEENTCKYCKECPAGNWDFEEELTCIQSVYVRAAALMNRQRAEIDRLSVELEAMRGAANSYKMHYEKAKTDVERLRAELSKMAADLQEQYAEFAKRQ